MTERQLFKNLKCVKKATTLKNITLHDFACHSSTKVIFSELFRVLMKQVPVNITLFGAQVPYFVCMQEAHAQMKEQT